MGIFKFIETKKRKKQNEKYFAEEREIQKPITQQIEKENYEEAYKMAKECYSSETYEKYFRQTKLFICLKLIDLCYKLKKDSEVDVYINAYKCFKHMF